MMRGSNLISLATHSMHNHGNNNDGGGHDSKMMWLMMLGCMLPIFFIAFTGGGAGRSSVWWILGAGAVMLGVHAFAMRGHGSHGHEDNAGTGATGNQPSVSPAADQTGSITPQPTADASATKGEHKHDCCS